MRVFVIGGGAAGFFAAIQCKTSTPDADVILIEKSDSVLAKVKISGGGRCNVTHACFDAKVLSEYYPRGGKALIGPFQRFQPRDTMTWFESRGVPLKIESDNRVFPVSDSSQSVIDCLMDQVTRLDIRLWTSCGVESIARKPEGGFVVTLMTGAEHDVDRLIMATGSGRQGYVLCAGLGHRIVEPVPSLFTIKIDDHALTALSGVSVRDVVVTVTGKKRIVQSGPLLITHWGFSGPAMIKLSAWAARDFHEANYQLPVQVCWLPHVSQDDIVRQLETLQKTSKKQCMTKSPFHDIPIRLWVYFLQKILGDKSEKLWSDISKKEVFRLAECLKNDVYHSVGKGMFKEEFVTCGGVALSEVNFKTMESRLCPGLFFAGEILDVDGVTGGFNFQNAWTTGFLAGTMA